MSSLVLNRRARFDYELLETFEAGLVLTGPEVKSIKAGKAHLNGAFVLFQNGELWLKGAHVHAYPPAAQVNPADPDRDRKLLLTKRELKHLIGSTQIKGLTLIPLSIYLKGGLIKVSFALGKGKKQYEKRDAIKAREIDRSLREHGDY